MNKVRIAWKIESWDSHGDWFPLRDRPFLEKLCGDYNEIYGNASHWVEEMGPDEGPDNE